MSDQILSTYSTRVREEWIDYNGHLSEAYYVLVFGFATDAAMEALGLGEDYREATGCSLYTVEAHVRYVQEVNRDAQLEVRTLVAGSAQKKLHLAHEMRVDGEVVATEEILGIHVDQTSGRATVLPEATRASAAERTVEAPAWVGRAIRV
ncbi:MAG TPA: thioesterase family protein [Brevibacterium senegalense]|uniref:Thioesterase family protein n=1 Tax=Brevibacterium senegalense TaxID=1033736 RepID=A0A921SNN8_9MICO|nr:thioesterase family protein [Brevibacterium senegalense]